MKLGFWDAIGIIFSGMTLEDIARREREWEEEMDRRKNMTVEIAYVRKDFVEALTMDYSCL